MADVEVEGAVEILFRGAGWAVVGQWRRKTTPKIARDLGVCVETVHKWRAGSVGRRCQV